MKIKKRVEIVRFLSKAFCLVFFFFQLRSWLAFIFEFEISCFNFSKWILILMLIIANDFWPWP